MLNSVLKSCFGQFWGKDSENNDVPSLVKEDFSTSITEFKNGIITKNGKKYVYINGEYQPLNY